MTLASFSAPLILIVVGIILYSISGQVPPNARPLLGGLSTVLVVLGALFLVIDLLGLR